MPAIAWTPDPRRARGSRLGRLLASTGLPGAAELRARAAADPEWFWPLVVEDLGVELTRPWERVLDLTRGPEWADWFVGARLNLAAACVDRRASGPGSGRAALIAEREDGETRVLSRRELAEQVARCSAALLAAGVGEGDRVAAFMPTSAEVAIQMFATARIGALFVPVFSGFGAEALAERLRDAGVRLLFTADRSFRRGEPIPILPTARRAVADSPSVERVVVVERGGPPLDAGETGWETFLAGAGAAPAAREVPAMHPALLLYTSGTTGRPKGTVHSHAGTLVNIAKEHGYAFDVGADDVFLWLTDIGWMMGPWLLVGALFHGATAVLYEGALDWPEPDRLWRLAARHGVSILGVSPTAIRLLRKLGAAPDERHDLGRLRVLGSTGEPWDEESWLWFFREVGGERCPVINISGGTDLIGCWLSPTPLDALKPCSLGGPGLGMAVDVWNEEGRSLRGEVGYLVATRPAPSMTRGLWNDPGRYLESYWSKWPGIWNHGDWAFVDSDGHWFLRGRADDTLKVAGKRLGPAEVEGALIASGRVSEAAAIGVPDEIKGEAIAVYVVLRSGVEPSDELRAELAGAVADRLGKLARPREVRFVADLPRTRSAKILRRLVRAVRLGEERLGDLSTLANPEALDAVRNAI